MAAPPGGRPRLTLLRLREIVLSADRFCDLEHVRVNSHAQTPHYHQNKIQTIFTFHSTRFNSFKKSDSIHFFCLIIALIECSKKNKNSKKISKKSKIFEKIFEKFEIFFYKILKIFQKF